MKIAMRPALFPIRLGFVLLLVLGLDTLTSAGDYFSILTSEAYQDAVVIGKIKSYRDQTIVFQPKRTLIGKKLAQKEFNIKVPPNIKPKPFEPGDPAVLTLEKDEETYRLTSEGFQVSDSDPRKAVVLSGPLYRDSRFMFQRIINSCGSDRQFSFDGKIISAQKFDQSQNRVVESIPIGVKQGDRYIAVEDNPPICPPEQISFWAQIIQVLSRIFS